jgi:hypothetical protein
MVISASIIATKKPAISENCKAFDGEPRSSILVDPNLRRWLAWIYASKRRELEGKKTKGEPYGHYWIRPKENDPILNRWVETSVRHLGVRLVWLADWTELGPRLKAMLSGS